jgi:hypothetical protein
MFNAHVSKGEQSSTEHRYNRPHEPQSSNPNRTMKRVRHKDVNMPVPRRVVRVGPKVTKAIVRMLNHQRPTQDTKMPQLHSRMGGWHMASECPQPCIKKDNEEGEWLRSCHKTRQLAQKMPSHTTQTPRFGLPPTTPSAIQSTSTARATSPPRRESPFIPAPLRKRARIHETPSTHGMDIKRRIQYLEEARRPMTPRAKQERLCQVKGKEVHHPQYENHGCNRKEAEETATVKHRYHRDDLGPSTSSAHPREMHRFSQCHKLGHYGDNYPMTKAKRRQGAFTTNQGSIILNSRILRIANSSRIDSYS